MSVQIATDVEYQTEDGSTWFFPVGGWSWQGARRRMAVIAKDEGGPLAVSRYVGKQPTQIHDHDEPWDEDNCPQPMCYVFEWEDR